MKSLFFLSIILTITACGGSSKVEFDQSMKDKNATAYNVEIRTTQTSEYCGGSRPSEELLNELAQPKPIGNTTIYLRKGKDNDLSQPIIYSFTSDENGLINAKIEKGLYAIVLEHKKDQKTYDTWLELYGEETEKFSAIDVNCFNSFFSQPDQTIEVINPELNQTANQFTVNTINRCERRRVPCASYKGPMPPVSPPK
jgi:hypothetical protein